MTADGLQKTVASVKNKCTTTLNNQMRSNQKM